MLNAELKLKNSCLEIRLSISLLLKLSTFRGCSSERLYRSLAGGSRHRDTLSNRGLPMWVEYGLSLPHSVEGPDTEGGPLACVEIHCRSDEGDVC